jgi:diguanylate cyclase (GGDEF)-like protein
MFFDLDDLHNYDSELLKLLTEQLPEMLWVKDKDGKYIYANKAICDNLLMARDVKEPIGKDDVFFAMREREAHKEKPEWHTFGELCSNSDQVVIENNRPMRFEEYGNVKGKLLYLEVFKAPFHDAEGNVIGTVGAGRDITKLKEVQQELEKSLKKLEEQRTRFEFQATHDALTGLSNKTLFFDHMQQSIESAKRKKKKFALLFIDLDHFKQINDSFGHETGDKILIEFARRLSDRCRSYDTLARIGGDEFCVLLQDVKKTEDIVNFTEDIKMICRNSFWVDNHEFFLSMSIGVSVYPEDATTYLELLKHADSAMYKAKAMGRDKYFFYNEEMTEKAYEYVMLEASLRNAIVQDEFSVFFQPQVDTTSEQVVGMEALVRWNKDGEIITPDNFIYVAEKSNLIIELDRVVIEKAIEIFLSLKALYENLESLSLNLSVKQLESKDFLRYIDDLNKRYGDLSFIVFEMTETLLMENLKASSEILQHLNNYGISVAIDDFGTGFSSLAYLKNLPIDKIKIDKSFIDEIENSDGEDFAITKSIVEIGKNLGLEVIAEGVETKTQASMLTKMGCTLIQGYFYAKPMPSKQLESFLSETAKNRVKSDI